MNQKINKIQFLKTEIKKNKKKTHRGFFIGETQKKKKNEQ